MTADDTFDSSLAKRILLGVSVGYFFLPFMLAGVNAILPVIGESLHASAHDLGIISATYTMGLAVAQIAAGRIGDIWGRKRLFLYGIALFSLTSLGLAFTRSLPIFILLRFLQGCGGALFNASGLALLAGSTPHNARGRYLGINASIIYAGIACGPPLSGFITGIAGWPWVFILCAIASLIAWFIMRFSVKQEWRISKGEPFDWLGCIICMLAMAALNCGAGMIASLPVVGLGLVTVTLLLLLLFWHWEKRTAFPLLHIQLFQTNKVFRLSSLASLINYSSIFGILFFFSLYLQTARHFDVQEAGLLLTVQAVVQVLASAWAGGIADKYGPSKISALGIALCGVGILYAVSLDITSPIWSILLIQIIMGLGVSLFAVPNTTILLSSAGETYLGQASSVNGAVRTTGMLMNMIIVTITLGFFLGNAPVGVENIPEFMDAMRIDFIIFGILNLLAVSCALSREKA